MHQLLQRIKKAIVTTNPPVNQDTTRATTTNWQKDWKSHHDKAVLHLNACHDALEKGEKSSADPVITRAKEVVEQQVKTLHNTAEQIAMVESTSSSSRLHAIPRRRV